MQAGLSIKTANLPANKAFHLQASRSAATVPYELENQVFKPVSQPVSQTFSCIIVFLINIIYQRQKQKHLVYYRRENKCVWCCSEYLQGEIMKQVLNCYWTYSTETNNCNAAYSACNYWLAIVWHCIVFIPPFFLISRKKQLKKKKRFWHNFACSTNNSKKSAIGHKSLYLNP